jgi:ribulose-5-phosphate 4-epimerase/fuculose-1-phosphate aldolase
MAARGYRFHRQALDHARVVLNVINGARPRPFRRRSKATYVIAVAETDRLPPSVLKAGYPLLVRALANLLIFVIRTIHGPRVYFVTLEQGCYEVPAGGDDDALFERVFDCLAPLAGSTLMIDNEQVFDLSEEVRLTDPVPDQLREAGRRLDRLGLLPAPFPLEKLVEADDLRHIHLLYGIGGLSYGNASARATKSEGFWMTASGVDKGRLGEAGRDILLVRGYDLGAKLIRVSVSPAIRPRRASVDAIEHALIYEAHPEVGAIVHVHAWMEGVPSTRINYPCGTYELARAVSELVGLAPDPARAIVGLKNHGLTITGPDLGDIFRRIDGRLLPRDPAT